MKVEVQNYKKSIYECGFTKEQETMIWDFYVTHSISSSASQKRKAKDYGLSKLPWKEMKIKADLEDSNVKILLANNINETLKRHGLEISRKDNENKNKINVAIEIDIPKIVCLTPFKIKDEEPPKGNIGETESVLSHIRNAFAHGNTYFFDNGMVLLEDKDKSKITAEILIKQQTLLDWIGIVDKEEKFYVLVDACEKCKTEES